MVAEQALGYGLLAEVVGAPYVYDLLLDVCGRSELRILRTRCVVN